MFSAHFGLNGGTTGFSIAACRLPAGETGTGTVK
jgi:hypothetical protein